MPAVFNPHAGMAAKVAENIALLQSRGTPVAEIQVRAGLSAVSFGPFWPHELTCCRSCTTPGLLLMWVLLLQP